MATRMGVENRIEALRRLAEMGITSAECGLYRLSAAELVRLANAVQEHVNEQVVGAVKSAVGR